MPECFELSESIGVVVSTRYHHTAGSASNSLSALTFLSLSEDSCRVAASSQSHSPRLRLYTIKINQVYKLYYLFVLNH